MSRNPLSSESGLPLLMSKQEGKAEAVLFIDRSEESLRLLEHLKGNGALQRIKVIEVNGLRGWLILEYGTPRVPLLVTENRIVAGAQEILSYLLSNKAEADER